MLGNLTFRLVRCSGKFNRLPAVSARGGKFAVRVSHFSSKGKNHDEGTVPDSFYDEGVETEQEFIDIANSLSRGGLEKLTSLQDNMEGSLPEISSFDRAALVVGNDSDTLNDIDEADTGIESSLSGSMGQEIFADDLASHVRGFTRGGGGQLIPEEMMDFNIPWRKTAEFPDPLLRSFVSNDAPEKYSFKSQGNRACSGKLQRSGKNPVLRCHLIDLDKVHYLDVVTLRKYLSDDAEILGKQATGLCAKCQRKVAKTIKTARNFGLLPHLGEYTLRDARPAARKNKFHEAASDATVRIESKSIL